MTNPEPIFNISPDQSINCPACGNSNCHIDSVDLIHIDDDYAFVSGITATIEKGLTIRPSEKQEPLGWRCRDEVAVQLNLSCEHECPIFSVVIAHHKGQVYIHYVGSIHLPLAT